MKEGRQKMRERKKGDLGSDRGKESEREKKKESERGMEIERERERWV